MLIRCGIGPGVVSEAVPISPRLQNLRDARARVDPCDRGLLHGVRPRDTGLLKPNVNRCRVKIRCVTRYIRYSVAPSARLAGQEAYPTIASGSSYGILEGETVREL